MNKIFFLFNIQGYFWICEFCSKTTYDKLKLVIIILLFNNLFSIDNSYFKNKDDWKYDVVKCTESTKGVMNSIFDLTIEIEKNHFNPNPEVFTALLAPIQNLIAICVNVQVDLPKYSDCVIRSEAVLPAIGKLVDAIEGKDTREIVFESSEVGLVLVNSISFCMGV